MTRTGRFRLLRLGLPLLLAAVMALASPWGRFQMDGSFGQAGAADLCAARSAHWATAPPPELAPAAGLPPLRAVTYNLHSGLGPQWRPFARRAAVEENLRAIARHLAGPAPAAEPVDVVGLNEVDFGSRRSGWIDQAEFLAAELGALTGEPYRVVRGETWNRRLPGLEVSFGNALLVRHPLLDADACELEETCPGGTEPGGGPAAGLLSRFFGEPRGVVRATIDFHGRPLDLLVTHLEAIVLKQREAQAADLLRRYLRPGVPAVLLGDINAVPAAMTGGRGLFAADRTHDVLTSGRLIDARVAAAAGTGAEDLSAWATYPAAAPELPLDGVFATAELLPRRVAVVGGAESDHRGLAVSYAWLDPAAARRHGRWHDGLRRRQLDRILACDFQAPGPDLDRRAAWLRAATGFGEVAAAWIPAVATGALVR